MDQLVQFLEREGKDAAELDEAVADYMVQLASEGGTEDEVWSVMEGCYPDLEEVNYVKPRTMMCCIPDFEFKHQRLGGFPTWCRPIRGGGLRRGRRVHRYGVLVSVGAFRILRCPTIQFLLQRRIS